MQIEQLLIAAVFVIGLIAIVRRVRSSGIKPDMRVTSIIGENAEINSDGIMFRGGLHIDGIVNQSIAGTLDEPSILIVSKNAKVVGNVRATNILVAGTIVGNLRAEGLVELAESAKIHGNIEYGQLKQDQESSISGSLTKI